MSLISQNAVLKQLKNDLDKEEVADRSSELELAEEIKEDQPKKKKRSREKLPDIDSESLEQMNSISNFLFANIYNPLNFGEEGNEEKGKESAKDAPLFIMDRSAGSEIVMDEEENLHDQEEEDVEEEYEHLKPAWVDEEEESAEVDIIKVSRLRKLRKEANERVISGADYVARLRAQHAKLNPGTEWARIDRKSDRNFGLDESDEEESDITVAPGYEEGSKSLLPGVLEYSRLVDANAEEPSNGPIRSVQFHRNGQLLLAAGLDRRLRFFQIDGKRNPKIESIFIEDCPPRKASFLPDGSQVIIAGRRKFFYCFDLEKAAHIRCGSLVGREEKSLEFFEVSPDSSTIAFIGNEGYILLVSARTKELIGTLKMNGSARSIAFAEGGQQLLSGGGDGEVYHWDLRTRRCIHKGIDDGSINTSSLCVSPDSSLFAAGSSSGIVNVYKREDFLGGKRKPLKTIGNLTTAVGHMKFHPDAQILAISSSMQKNGIKLVHIPSFNVFSNYPPPRFSMQSPLCMDFSPGGGFMTVGNAAGKVLLYKLHHYKSS